MSLLPNLFLVTADNNGRNGWKSKGGALPVGTPVMPPTNLRHKKRRHPVLLPSGAVLIPKQGRSSDDPTKSLLFQSNDASTSTPLSMTGKPVLRASRAITHQYAAHSNPRTRWTPAFARVTRWILALSCSPRWRRRFHT